MKPKHAIGSAIIESLLSLTFEYPRPIVLSNLTTVTFCAGGSTDKDIWYKWSKMRESKTIFIIKRCSFKESK